MLNWKVKESPFVEDVLNKRLRYLYNKNHKETWRYKRGQNPEIFSVIRYFIKMFQHELQPYSEDRVRLEKIIKDFRPKSVNERYIEYWLYKNVPKLFLHSRDVEYAWNTLEEFGLRQKLLRIGDRKTLETPAWWASKEPLASFELGLGDGKTAKELRIEYIAHDTPDLKSWVTITRSRRGVPNFFISRKNTNGESAVYGSGVYGMYNSKSGFWNTGATVLLRLNPGAREWSDFELVRKFGIIIVKNRNAIEVVSQKFKAESLMEYFKMFVKQSGKDNNQVLMERLKRRIDNYYVRSMDEKDAEIKEVIEYIWHKNNFNVRYVWD